MIDLETIETLKEKLSPIEVFHVLRHDPVSEQNLSYKESFGALSAFYLDANAVANAISYLVGLRSAAMSLSSSYVLKKSVDDQYEKKDTLENDKPGLLTNSELEAILTKYVKSENVGEKASAVREYVMQLRDAMTSEIYSTIANIHTTNRSMHAMANQIGDALEAGLIHK